MSDYDRVTRYTGFVISAAIGWPKNLILEYDKSIRVSAYGNILWSVCDVYEILLRFTYLFNGFFAHRESQLSGSFQIS
jgi:hypothetical protein